MNMLRLLIPICLLFVSSFAMDTVPSLPKLHRLSSVSRNSLKDSTIRYSLDSAMITLPHKRKNLTGTATPITVVPNCKVAAITIFVSHSGLVTDTLAFCTKAPFTTEWNFSAIADQDQVHLQFGYILHIPGGNKIISRALPHNWAIDRSTKLKKKICHCRQTLHPDTIIINGILDDWNKKRFIPLRHVGSFSFSWTNAALYFCAQIHDTAVTRSDFVEVHLDPFYTRTTFSGKKHRSIRFSPISRNYFIIAQPGTDSTTYIQSDSIAALLSAGMEWMTIKNSDGYTIEAALPFYALSDLDFPRLRSGMDVTVKTGDTQQQYISWSGSTLYNRYNPSEWGILSLHQAMFPLKLTLFISALIIGIFCCIVVIKLIYHYFYSQQIEKTLTDDSPQLDHIREAIDTHIGDSSLSIEIIAQLCHQSIDALSETLERELECTFNHFLITRRILKAKNDLWDFSLPFQKVATRAGFASLSDMENAFKILLHTDPVHFRAMANEIASDDDNDTSSSDTNKT